MSLKATVSMSKNWSQYSLEQLRENAIKTFRVGGGSRPDVLLIEIDGQRAVLKDQNRADKWFARIVGPILNWRECKALIRLEHLDCTPNLICRPDARSFVMSYHESEQITRLTNKSPNWPDFFRRLSIAVQQIHEAGVAHNDLRNPTNTLITADGQPILVDLVACFCRGKPWNLPNRWLFKKFSQVDLSAMTKLKQRVAPELLDETDIYAEQIAGRPGLWIKGLGQIIRKLSRKLFTR
jgi:hypothetical protein